MSTLILSSCSRSVPELLSYIVEDVRPPDTCHPHEASTLMLVPQRVPQAPCPDLWYAVLWCQVGLREFIEGTGKDEEKAKEKGRNLLELVRASQSYKDAGRHRSTCLGSRAGCCPYSLGANAGRDRHGAEREPLCKYN